jgi:hypothetical protein
VLGREYWRWPLLDSLAMIRAIRIGLEEDAHLLGGHPHHPGDVLDGEEHPPRRPGAARAEAQQVHVADQLLPIDVLGGLDPSVF